MKNKNLHAAKKAKNDEFYTMLTDIEKELKHYKDQFKDKVVYCNCDNPQKSEFVRFFRLKFCDWGLKKLIATCITEDNSNGWGYIWDKDINGNGIMDEEEVTMIPLEQNGDFRSPECIEFLKEADIVVTNPPFSCYSSDTEVLTNNGWKFFKDVDITTDKIYSLNPDTNEIEIVKAVDFIKSPVNGNLLNFKSTFMDIEVTDNHKMFTYYKTANKGIQYKGLIEAKDVQKSNYLKIKGFSYNGENKNIFTLPATTQKEQYSGKDIEIPEKDIPMNDWLEFFGFWLADGCCRNHINTYGKRDYTVSIKQHIRNEQYVLDLVNRIGFTARLSCGSDKTNKNYNIYSKQLWEYLHQFGKSKTKYIPREFLNLGKENLVALYKGYINGDSYKGNGGIILSSKSKQLMSDFQEIILKLFGQIVSVRTVNTTYNQEPYTYYNISYCDTQHHNYSKYGIPEKVPYNDFVYCLTLAKNHIMLTKRNGKIAWCGNCFRDYVKQLMDNEKKFLIIGNNNAVTYKEIFPYIKEGKLRLGHAANKTFYFEVPDGYAYEKEENGKKYGKVPAISWFTNLETHKADDPMELVEKFDPVNKHLHYDNYNAYNVDKVADIPYDTDEVLGVPITITDRIADDGYIHFTHNEEEMKFEIVAFRKGEDGQDLVFTREREREFNHTFVSLYDVDCGDDKKRRRESEWENYLRTNNDKENIKPIDYFFPNATNRSTGSMNGTLRGKETYRRILIQKL